MRIVEASAPGKLYLLGEYAILYGGEALVMAVDRRVHVSVSLSDAWLISAGEIDVEHVEIPDHAITSATHLLECDPGLNHRLRFVFSVIDEFRLTQVSALPALEISIDSSQLYASRSGNRRANKLGLGSSAALSAVLTLAISEILNLNLTADERFNLAKSAHRKAQGGGSGGDVAASTFGGAISISQDGRQTATLPSDLEILAVATGDGSETANFIAEIERFEQSQPETFQADIDTLIELSHLTTESISRADSFMNLADRYFLALEKLGADSKVGIVTSEHSRLRALAAEAGAVFKTSGAGGGDLGLVFATRSNSDNVKTALTSAGVQFIPIPLSREGARVESK